jgi:RNA polymerase sigma-70 factor (ECF subfamily)
MLLYVGVGAEARAEQVEQDPIVALVRAGAHAEAAERCARDHGRAIGRLCMAMLGDQAEAEEAVQETFLAAYRAIAQFRGDGRVLSWLVSIARRICVRRLESRARQQARRLELVHDADDQSSPMELAERKRRARSLRGALAELKPSEREILLLRYQAELSFREVAEACGLDEPAARKRASRALARLRALLKNEVE